MKRKLKNAWAVALPAILAVMTAFYLLIGLYFVAAAFGLFCAMHLIERYLQAEIADQRLMAIGAATVVAMARDGADGFNGGDA